MRIGFLDCPNEPVLHKLVNWHPRHIIHAHTVLPMLWQRILLRVKHVSRHVQLLGYPSQ
jgi:hypothetical protein